MIIDSHCHAWETFPYDMPIPDPESRGNLSQLIFEMDSNKVDRALIVCAQISLNPENNQYIYEQTQAHGDRFKFVVDVDSFWSATYHTIDAADRLRQAVSNWHPAGFTHYIADPPEDSAWLNSYAAIEMFEVAQEHNLIASIHCQPHHQADIGMLAQRFPQVPILIHHMGHPRSIEPEGLSAILANAVYENVYIKVSGFYNSTSHRTWDFPLDDVQPIVHALYKRYGAQRLLWGSDYPVSQRFFTYRQTLEIVRYHCKFISADDLDYVMGNSLEALLNDR